MTLSQEGLRAVADIAERTGFSRDAVAAMLSAVVAGHGSMAQFSHPEFGGAGQWMSGGAIMLSDMFDHALKARVSALCAELSALAGRETGVGSGSFQSQSQTGGAAAGGRPSSLFVSDPSASASWWPADLGAPASVGAQNSARYAYFPAARRLAVDIDGRVTVYDTLDHLIGGFSQQQSGSGTFAFTSQHGTVNLDRLPIAGGDPTGSASPASAPAPASAPTPAAAPVAHEAILAVIEKLADLRAKGVLTEDEFSGKKAELLKRL